MKILQKFLLCVLLISLFVLSTIALAAENTVRVGLYYSASAIENSVEISLPIGVFSGTYSNETGFVSDLSFDSKKITISKNDQGELVLTNAENNTIMKTVEVGKPLYIYPYCVLGEMPYSLIKGKKYPQTLEFSVDTNGRIKVINIVELEQYIKGVLPSEVYSSWEPDALKAAAVATRTYTLKNLDGKHSSLGFDVCNSTCCQVYEGITKTAESTDKATDDTCGEVLTYNGSLASTVYHSLSGGITESAYGAWGGNPNAYPYLTIVKTPFEDYEKLSIGSWNAFIPPAELLDTINASGYKGTLTSEIAAIECETDGGEYIHKMTITDTSGNSIDVKSSSSVRSLFNKYAISANFTIGRTYIPSDEKAESITVMTSSGKQSQSSSSGYTYVTADGRQKTFGISDVYALYGKGYGHGVGMSQYGAHFAAKAGYDYKKILQIYYPGTVLEKQY